MKVCPKCGHEKPFDAFTSRVWPNGRVGYQSWCKACHNLVRAENRRKNLPHYRSTIQAWRQANPELAHEGDWRRGLMKSYGITPTDYDALLDKQGGVCAICGRPETLPGRVHLCVDHDHNTGKVRGLLCSDCNTSIGKMQDDPKILRAAADYLERFLLDGHPMGFRGGDD